MAGDYDANGTDVVVQRHAFAEPVTGEERTLVIPAGGSRHGPFGSKIGIEHPGCMVLADLSPELDAFYCPRCGATGRVSGAWCSELIEASLTAAGAS